MPAKIQGIDDAIMSRAKDHAITLESKYALRNADFEQYEKMFLLDWTDKPTAASKIKTTISPDPRNAVMGAVRLMMGTDPHFNLPESIPKKEVFEQAADKAWIFAGKVMQEPVHHAALMAGFLYSEMHIVVSSTAHMLEHAKKAAKGIKRAERIANLTPFLFEVWNPRYGYPEFDNLGLRAYLRKVKVKPYELLTRFGELVKDIVTDPNADTDHDLYIYYNEDDYAVWVDNTPIIAMLHELSRIPVVVGVCEGSMIFPEPEKNRQPMLYTPLKSGIWQRQNLSLTILYDNLYKVGITPTVVHTAPGGNPGKELVTTEADNMRIIELESDERYEILMNKGLLDASLTYTVQLAEQKMRESTIYPQALGEPMGGNQAFSTVSLLSQAGRLPLIGVQRRGSWAIGTAMDIAFEMYRDTGVDCKGFGIKPKDVPAELTFDCQLDVDLPQDKLQMANVARILTTGDRPLTTKSWARQNILGIGQSDKMDEDIWTEDAATKAFVDFLTNITQQMAMAQAAQQTGGPLGGPNAPVNPNAPPVVPPMTPDGSQPTMVPGQAESITGLPPEMAGLLPGGGGGAMPAQGPMEQP